MDEEVKQEQQYTMKAMKYFDKSKAYGMCPICAAVIIVPVYGDQVALCDNCKNVIDVEY